MIPSSEFVHEILPAPPDRLLRYQVAGIILPDAVNAEYWFAAFAALDAEATHAQTPHLAKPGGVFRARITYPALRAVRDVAWVYVGWRGFWRWRHQADRPSRMRLRDLRTMDPLWGSQVIVGDPYLWVFAAPVLVPNWKLPVILPGQVRRGTVAGTHEDLEPHWR